MKGNILNDSIRQQSTGTHMKNTDSARKPHPGVF